VLDTLEVSIVIEGSSAPYDVPLDEASQIVDVVEVLKPYARDGRTLVGYRLHKGLGR
jgi:hypothetical protein